MTLQPNPGFCSSDARGRRVRVILENGYDTAASDKEANGWAADGRTAGDMWSHRGTPFSIAQWELIR